MFTEGAVKQRGRHSGMLKFEFNLAGLLEGTSKHPAQDLAAAQGAWWVSSSPGAASPH